MSRDRMMDQVPRAPGSLYETRTGPAPYGSGAASHVVPRPHAAAATGVGTSIAQHGELLQGQLEDHDRRRRRFLVSLPCDRFYSRVTYRAARDGELSVEPGHKTKVRKVVELALARFGLDYGGGTIIVESNIEEGKGYGSSTADCVAGVHAAADAAGRRPTEEEVAELVVAGEIASDNFMFSRPVLFAHREGVALEDLGPRLPSVEVLGLDTELDGAVYTLDHPPAVYDWRQIQVFHTLVAALRRAVRHGDVALLGRVATASSVINQQFLPKPMFSELRRLAECVQALGIAVAHSGTVLSLLFDRSNPALEASIEQARREIEALGVATVHRFRT